MKPQIKEAIVVEGRYDKNTLSQVVDALILETQGFGIFQNRALLALLRRLAEEQGLIVFTDADGAGFVIRNFLKGAIPAGQMKHAYIPTRFGKERRKVRPGKEGKLGVEGMRPEVLLDALRQAGATFTQIPPSEESPRRPITKADLFRHGLSGGPNAAVRRRELLRILDLPEHMSTNALLEVLNRQYSYEAYQDILQKC